MKTKSRKGLHRFQLKLLGYGNNYYIERVGKLESALARKPRRFQLDLIGEGEIPADTALLICSILRKRSSKTQLVTNAQSSLQGGSVLVWLSGDIRLIREDARVFFRRSEESDDDQDDANKNWKQCGSAYSDSDSETDPQEADYARVLHVINEFLPVKELAGRPVLVPVLRRFGLVETEKLDRFLATAFGKLPEAQESSPSEPKEKRVPAKVKNAQAGQAGRQA
jgi:hypothetical protein